MKNLIAKKRSQRIRNKLKKVNLNRLRLSIFRSSKNISIQIIDDKSSKTLVSASSLEKKILDKSKVKRKDYSGILGEIVAKRALEKKISKVYFDRGKYRYHGKIKELADSLRKNGLIF
jgi:large subunit ribosomal protein L18